MIDTAAMAEQIPALRRYARALLRDASQADDLVQDCLERALSRQHLFRPGTNLRAWLFTIMHNQFVNFAKRRGRAPDVVPLDDEGGHLPGGAVAPDQGGRLRLRDLSRALDALPEEQRAVVLLVGLEDLSYRETAEVLDVPVGTVMSRLARGRERLRRLMEPPEAGSGGEPGLRGVK
ncbi:MAG: sigma-70 family RNA polymerase sigma factor [Hyphomicrobiales bacterium]|nr:sigma-70 family RNA polymerase sigma factor [Hyphomicrobiales bacterium]MCP5371994.1 sigma-70 family RNA polymerase sigma factor [Hyphomicrobiales bacterium]